MFHAAPSVRESIETFEAVRCPRLQTGSAISILLLWLGMLAIPCCGANAADANRVEIPGVAPAAVPKFELDIQPMLTSSGCNMGACHGKARGQNGFALSLLGIDCDFDYHAIVDAGRMAGR